ncbi:MAG: hypothetical protein Q9164_001895 [Protoblastenia rupestris]
MCKNLAEKGNLSQPLLVYNRTKQRAQDLCRALSPGQSEVVDSIQDGVARSEIIFTCVGDDKAITETIETAIQGNVKDKLFVDCSTVHPDCTAKLAETLNGKGAGFVACPVFGAPPLSAAGLLILVLAGPKPLTSRILPYTTGVLGRAVLDLSGQPQRQASLLKIIGNTFVVQMIEALAEGHVLAEKSGLGVDNVHKFVELMFPGPYAKYSERFLQGDYYNRDEVRKAASPLFAVDLALKDCNHALDLATTSGAKLKAVEVGKAHLELVKKERGTKGDIAGIYGAVRRESGLVFGIGD